MACQGPADDMMNEVRSRQANEWIDQMIERCGTRRRRNPYRCECSYADCDAVVSLTPGEYQAVRTDGTHFVVATNHEDPVVDFVVCEMEGFAIVGKLPGKSARLARDTNPRSG